MNKEEILNKYIDLIDKGYCSDCNELNCIDNFPHSKITHAIRELQQENKILRENAEHNDKVVDKVNWENQKLKEVIDKAIKYISSNDIEVLKYHDIPSETTSYEIVTIDLLKILKGGEINKRKEQIKRLEEQIKELNK